jgi:hypothetical protein
MIPNGIEKRKQYNDLINRGVQLLREKEELDFDMNQLKTEVEEEIGKDFAKTFLKKVKIRHKCGVEEEKVERIREILAELEILEKAGNSENSSSSMFKE